MEEVFTDVTGRCPCRKRKEANDGTVVTNRHFHNTPGFKASNAITGNLIKAVMEQAVKGSTGKTINRHRRGAWRRRRRRKEEGGWVGGWGGGRREGERKTR